MGVRNRTALDLYPSISVEWASYLIPLVHNSDRQSAWSIGVTEDGNPMRIRGADSIVEVMERIVDRGLVVDPWSGIRLREPDALKRYRWTADVDVFVGEGCRLDHVA